MSSQLPLRPGSFVLRWNRRWISGDRFARDYAASVMAFTSEVAQSVMRVHRSKQGPALCDVHTHAVVWAAVLVAFEAASFRAQDHDTLLAMLLDELRPSWSQGDLAHSEHAARILQRSEAYFATRDRTSPLKSAELIVGWYLRALGMPERVGASALSRHLCANFSHRILRDIYRLSAASRLRAAVVSLMERQRAAMIAKVDTCGLSIWDEQQNDTRLARAAGRSAPEPVNALEDRHWDGHPIEVIARAGSA